MNPSTPDPALIEKLIAEFQPNPRRIPFHNLEPHRALIEALRQRGASYQTITAILKSQGVETSRSRLAEYGRRVLTARKPRRAEKPAAARIRGAPLPKPSVGPPAQTPDTAHAPGAPVSQPSLALPGMSNAASAASEGRRSGPRIARIKFVDGTYSGTRVQRPGTMPMARRVRPGRRSPHSPCRGPKARQEKEVSSERVAPKNSDARVTGGVTRAPIIWLARAVKVVRPSSPCDSTLTALASPQEGRLGVTLALCTPCCSEKRSSVEPRLDRSG